MFILNSCLAVKQTPAHVFAHKYIADPVSPLMEQYSAYTECASKFSQYLADNLFPQFAKGAGKPPEISFFDETTHYWATTLVLSIPRFLAENITFAVKELSLQENGRFDFTPEINALNPYTEYASYPRAQDSFDKINLYLTLNVGSTSTAAGPGHFRDTSPAYRSRDASSVKIPQRLLETSHMLSHANGISRVVTQPDPSLWFESVQPPVEHLITKVKGNKPYCEFFVKDGQAHGYLYLVSVFEKYLDSNSTPFTWKVPLFEPILETALAAQGQTCEEFFKHWTAVLQPVLEGSAYPEIPANERMLYTAKPEFKS